MRAGLPSVADYVARGMKVAADSLAWRYKLNGRARGQRRKEREAVGALRRALQLAKYSDDLALRVQVREALADIGRDGRGHRINTFAAEHEGSAP